MRTTGGTHRPMRQYPEGILYNFFSHITKLSKYKRLIIVNFESFVVDGYPQPSFGLEILRISLPS